MEIHETRYFLAASAKADEPSTDTGCLSGTNSISPSQHKIHAIMKLQAEVRVFPELAYDAAPDQVRAIYDEICRWAAVPIPALIFRHLATHKGVLEEVWDGIGPLFRNGQIPEAAWRVASAATPVAFIPTVEANARTVIGLTDSALAQAYNALDAYNRANPVNLLAMLSLLERLKSDDAVRPLSSRTWTPPAPVPTPMPPMAPLDTMPPDIRLLINDLGFGDRSTIDPVVPSLYRHFTNWPGYLALLHVLLVPRFRDGSLATATEHVHLAMKREASTIALSLPPLPHLSEARDVHITMARFTTTVIPQMIVIGNAMRRSLT